MTPSANIDRLIVNSAFAEPVCHWRYDRATRMFNLEDGRRPAGYVVASGDSAAFDDPGVFREIPLVNRIRERVTAWRAGGYPGVTGVTKRLLEHWTDPEEFENRRFFFCQLEAAETLIWLTEAPPSERLGITIPSDGSALNRFCAKMATGTGKTVVMAMVIAWQVLNKIANPRDSRFAKDILVVAPGLTVRSRLSVLVPSNPDNYYEEFRVVPSALRDKLRRGRVMIRNWHALNWETQEQISKKRGVDKRGPKSDAAFVRDVLGEMATARNLLIINDEAHHAWRVSGESKPRGLSKSAVETATKWVGGLDRIHRARGILACYDFSATPFVPTGRSSSEESLFSWIVSDFGLNEAIESGLVKTPRVVIRDDAVPDAKTYKSRLYHIYQDAEVRGDLNRRARPEEPLPDLVMNGYYLLGYDWQETAKDWTKSGAVTPPVLITVANRTETAARIKHAFDSKRVRIDGLCDPERTLHIDSKVLASAEGSEEPVADIGSDWTEVISQPGITSNLTKKQRAELLRRQVDTVGRVDCPGEQIQNVISVRMLSEGWDAKTVTHIMGLRAFTSQLLCEQVVGRGLRRTSYDVNPETGLFEPEHVNVFGVPFTFLPYEGRDGRPPPPSKPKTAIEPVADKAGLSISWPNVLRVDHTYRPRLSLELERVEPLYLDASRTAQLAELAATIDGKPDIARIDSISLDGLAREFRNQKIIFESARDVLDVMRAKWPGSTVFLLAELVRIIEQVIRSDKIVVTPEQFAADELKRRLVVTLNATKVVQHILESIRHENTSKIEPVFDQDRPIGATGNMRTWFTGKPCAAAARSHINYCVLDSAWESSDAFALDHSPEVAAWVKNDHLGFEVHYIHRGVVRKYRPDFLVRLKSGDMLVLETKGQDSEQDRTKRRYLAEWVEAVNSHGGFGLWRWDIALNPGEIHGILARHSSAEI